MIYNHYNDSYNDKTYFYSKKIVVLKLNAMRATSINYVVINKLKVIFFTDIFK